MSAVEQAPPDTPYRFVPTRRIAQLRQGLRCTADERRHERKTMMKKQSILLLTALLTSAAVAEPEEATYQSDDLKIVGTKATYEPRLDSVVMEMTVEGKAGGTPAREQGQLDGAHVVGYVFPTSLKPGDVGFSKADGIVALALTSHPDFDDTPLWDENIDGNYDNDGVVWHPHWVLLVDDKRVAGGLSVRQFNPEKNDVTLPPTAPGMPMFMDSPGFNVVEDGNTIRVIVPAFRLSGKTEFDFDAVTAFMKVNTSNKEFPMLGVYEVYSVASGDLSLPYSVRK